MRGAASTERRKTIKYQIHDNLPIHGRNRALQKTIVQVKYLVEIIEKFENYYTMIM